MRKPRNYQAEYARRIAKGVAKGLSRSQARGHPRSGETYVSAHHVGIRYDPTLEDGLKRVRRGQSMTQAARTIHVSLERLSRYIRQSGLELEKAKGRWRIVTDDRVRKMQIFSYGKVKTIHVRGHITAADVGRYMVAVRHFLETNNADILQPFIGTSIRDIHGKSHLFETRPNVLYRLDQASGESFEQVYRIVI